MRRHSRDLGLAALLVLLLGAVASAQGLEDMQIFGPTNDSRYGGGYRPNEGYFFSFDGLYWHIGAPDVVPIGKPGLTRESFYTPTRSRVQHNTHDTGDLDSDLVPGNRFEFGHISEHDGWIMSIFTLRSQTQRLAYGGVDVVIEDVGFGDPHRGFLEGWVRDAVPEGETAPAAALEPLPIRFDDVFIKNTVEMWGTELSYKYRCHPFRNGGILEWFAGARYLEFDDEFNVFATGERFYPPPSAEAQDQQGATIAPGTILADSEWDTEAENHIIGPQVGVRWFRRAGRLTISSEGRFFAGANFQNIRQHGILGSKLNDPLDVADLSPTSAPLFVPDVMNPASFNHRQTNTEWAPAAEFRLEGKYQLTEAFTVKCGWTGMYIDGLVRASNKVDYQISPTKVMGIREDNTRQELWVNGFNVGFDVNY